MLRSDTRLGVDIPLAFYPKKIRNQSPREKLLCSNYISTARSYPVVTHSSSQLGKKQRLQYDVLYRYRSEISSNPKHKEKIPILSCSARPIRN